MRPPYEVARELLQASLQASDDLGIPTDDEELAYLTPAVEKRDQEVALSVLDSLNLALGLEAEGHTGQALYYYTRARKLISEARLAWSR